jgi:hypothetical protein
MPPFPEMTPPETPPAKKPEVPVIPVKIDRSKARLAEDVAIAAAHKAEDEANAAEEKAREQRSKLKSMARVAEAGHLVKARAAEDVADEERYQNEIIAAGKQQQAKLP